jgi:N-acetylmuramic acid 6-phosphate etherase
MQMVDLKPSNNKLRQRSRNIIRSLSGHRAPSSDEEIDALLSETGGSVKLALAVLLLDANVDEARKRLNAAGGRLSEAAQKTIPSNPGPLQADASLSGLVLCVDGGATKCAAVVMDSSGRVGRGQAGPCNV